MLAGGGERGDVASPQLGDARRSLQLAAILQQHSYWLPASWLSEVFWKMDSKDALLQGESWSSQLADKAAYGTEEGFTKMSTTAFSVAPYAAGT